MRRRRDRRGRPRSHALLVNVALHREDLSWTKHGPTLPARPEMVGMEDDRGGRHRPDTIQKESFSGMGEVEKDFIGGEERSESAHRQTEAASVASRDQIVHIIYDM